MSAPRGSDKTSYDSIPRPQIPAILRANLPAAVRKLKAFVVFKFRPPKKPGGKRAKLPFYVVDGTMRHGEQASKQDRTRLVTFAEAVRLFETDSRWGGIGVCALEGNPVFFVDIDNCFDAKGRPNALAEELLSWGTYTEYSPSGKGLRMILAGNLGINRKRHSVGLELFCTSGFVTLTGLRYDKQHAAVKSLNKQQHARLHNILDVPAQSKSELDDIVSIPNPLTKERKIDINRALRKVDPDLGYTEWLLIGQALHSGDPDPTGWGFKKWLEWSTGGDKFEGTSEKEMLRKWKGFKAGKGVTTSSLFGIAKQYGFSNSDKEVKDLPKEHEDDYGVDPDQVEEKQLHPLAENLFDHYGAYMFIGRAKIGKSRILGALVAGALAGGSALGFNFNKKCRVLAFTLEEDAFSLLNRVRAYAVEPSEYKGKFKIIDEAEVVKYAKKYGEEYDWAQWFEMVVRKVKPDFIYVDTPVKMRMMWQNDPEYKSKNVTEQDYQMAASLDRIAQKYGCVVVSVIHGSKRKSQAHGFDPFESIGTTSWTLAGCTGALVLMDKPGHNPMEEAEDGQKVLSVRGRYQTSGDLHYLMQSNPNGTFSNIGDYHHVVAQVRADEFLQIIKEAQDGGAEFVNARTIAAISSKSEKTVKNNLHRVVQEAKLYEGRKLIAVQGSGYRLEDPDQKGPTKRPKGGPSPEEILRRDRAKRSVEKGKVNAVDPFS